MCVYFETCTNVLLNYIYIYTLTLFCLNLFKELLLHIYIRDFNDFYFLILLLNIGFYIGKLKFCFDLNCDLFLEKTNSRCFN